MNDFIPKPNDKSQLRDTLTQHIQGPCTRTTLMQPPGEPDLARETWEAMPAEIPGINLDRALNRIGGNTVLLRNILRSFLEQYSGVEAILNGYLEKGNVKEVQRLVHSIKGTSGNIGAESLFAAAGDLERQLKSSPGRDLIPALETFLKSHNRIIACLKELNLDQSPEDLSISSAQTPIDVDKVRPLLRDMDVLLKKSDSRARHLLPNLKALLRGTPLASDLDRLDRAIFRLDSDLALECLASIAAKLQISMGEDKEPFHVDER